MIDKTISDTAKICNWKFDVYRDVQILFVLPQNKSKPNTQQLSATSFRFHLLWWHLSNNWKTTKSSSLIPQSRFDDLIDKIKTRTDKISNDIKIERIIRNKN